jgi:hypothetical protein
MFDKLGDMTRDLTNERRYDIIQPSENNTK